MKTTIGDGEIYNIRLEKNEFESLIVDLVHMGFAIGEHGECKQLTDLYKELSELFVSIELSKNGDTCGDCLNCGRCTDYCSVAENACEMFVKK